MRILAIDTSLPAVSVGVFDSETPQALVRETVPMQKGHAEALMPMIERVAAQVDGGFASLDRVAATVGPGSFTGIRIGVAAARGIALACGVEAVGVSALTALAAPLLFSDEAQIVAAAIDALHGNVYFSAYAARGRVLASPRIVGIADACRLLGAGQVVAVGSGAEALREAAKELGQDLAVAERDPWPDIAAVAKLGIAADPQTAPARPLYLKAPDVTRSTKPSVLARAAP
ncbi:tRNA threonylcarbamoyl adenosine modification protein YeaZ [Rhodoblastus acidophilus]|uniref:tRNA threonylcarbamoyl adenosine modification protein YeaZ n=1 Tax=Rhodoblastus acidophilus TaxID=1074 RepID=A0A212RLS8_RHOAC|nr:tRNA (adenosine(37)-N6)-threonylcarbamoyltransferase complex dimerization subunit type 1 TsaB [Rhodoblastus acidophilus]PPQ39116.1 tRNA (adenosine(37)-N6)-threonylcarbamoyltransferase complex dimerization subunit type 1 TsaB [Rhodoblastus acidophilus]RAI24176.1 tRNA (adenosine(37)-N6)-threonylcarbamoyltransferase complex dimerization subunit type 1 TsaB [Rhodoblastus acidophilus]SNB73419.1 tRNA threonylcarbamoyl adenosine modification protein YeaZ [Rhodoblastus acidophilus]